MYTQIQSHRTSIEPLQVMLDLGWYWLVQCRFPIHKIQLDFGSLSADFTVSFLQTSSARPRGSPFQVASC